MNRFNVLKSLSFAGTVKRWHTWPMLRQQSVGEHSARVATIYCEMFGLPRAEVLYFILHHDAGELYGGDVPFGVKRDSPGTREASNAAEKRGLELLGVELPTLEIEEYAKFKVCDIAEMLDFAVTEENMGNRYATPVVESCFDALDKLFHSYGVMGNTLSIAFSEWIKKPSVVT